MALSDAGKLYRTELEIVLCRDSTLWSFTSDPWQLPTAPILALLGACMPPSSTPTSVEWKWMSTWRHKQDPQPNWPTLFNYLSLTLPHLTSPLIAVWRYLMMSSASAAFLLFFYMQFYSELTITYGNNRRNIWYDYLFERMYILPECPLYCTPLAYSLFFYSSPVNLSFSLFLFTSNLNAPSLTIRFSLLPCFWIGFRLVLF